MEGEAWSAMKSCPSSEGQVAPSAPKKFQCLSAKLFKFFIMKSEIFTVACE